MGKARVAVPRDVVDTIMELELAPPPPLARRWVGGLGQYQDKAVVCVSLVPVGATGKQEMKRTVRGIMCKVQDSEVRWMLEIAAVISFVRLKLLPARAPAPNQGLPSWIVAAATSDRKTMGYVDVEAMVRELVGTA